MDWIAAGLTLVFVAYMIVTDRVAGTSYSISNSYYKWKEKKRSYMFIVFLTCITLGLWYIAGLDIWKNNTAPILIVLGGTLAFAIGIAANFKQNSRIESYHNWFSVLCFACVHIGFYFQEIKFPLECFALCAAALAPIKLSQRTTVIESIGIALAIAAVYYL